jgi:hypothetical protein
VTPLGCFQFYEWREHIAEQRRPEELSIDRQDATEIGDEPGVDTPPLLAGEGKDDARVERERAPRA